ncbi:MAG: hypothetical protein ACOYW7_06975 [Nitrospirota bacterium]
MNKESSGKLRTCLTVNSVAVPLNDFTQNYIANVLSAVVRSFGVDSTRVTVSIDGETLHILTEDGGIDLAERDFAKQLVINTLKGVLSPLKGVFWLQKIDIISDDPA